MYILEQALDDLTISIDCAEGSMNCWARSWRSELNKLNFENVKSAVYTSIPPSLDSTTSLPNSSPPLSEVGMDENDAQPESLFEWEYSASISSDVTVARPDFTPRHESAKSVFVNRRMRHAYYYHLNEAGEPYIVRH